jgi:predicted RNA binding protein YcfA (HicA-like mRNA interferase family)
MKSFTPEVKKIQREAGCRLVRQGKGDHEIWESPITKRRFVVDNAIPSRHTANTIMKQAGLPKAV